MSKPSMQQYLLPRGTAYESSLLLGGHYFQLSTSTKNNAFPIWQYCLFLRTPNSTQTRKKRKVDARCNNAI